MKHNISLLLAITSMPFICFAQVEQIDSAKFVQESKVDTINLSDNFTTIAEKNTLPTYNNLSFKYNPEINPMFNYRIAQPFEPTVPKFYMEY